MIDNLLAAFERATADQRAEGERWYSEAKSFAAQIAAEFDLSLDVAAALVAVTSNNIQWERQVAGLPGLIRHLKAGGSPEDYRWHLKTIQRKAALVLAGDTSACRGPKVEAFWANIAGDLSIPTVDRWAIRAAIPELPPTEEACKAYTKGSKRDEIAAAYVAAAAMVGVPAAVFQAIVWVVVRSA